MLISDFSLFARFRIVLRHVGYMLATIRAAREKSRTCHHLTLAVRTTIESERKNEISDDLSDSFNNSSSKTSVRLLFRLRFIEILLILYVFKSEKVSQSDRKSARSCGGLGFGCEKELKSEKYCETSKHRRWNKKLNYIT